MVDTLVMEVALKHKEVAVCLTPPLAGLGFLSTLLAPKEEKPKVPELKIYLAYDLPAHSGAGPHCATMADTRSLGLRPCGLRVGHISGRRGAALPG
jgi:hypothetical protein